MDNLAPQIARLFEDARERPGEPIPEYFLDGLLTGAPRPVDDSWHGKRRKVAFLRQVEIHYAICFTRADQERLWRFSAFVDRVAERRASPEANRQTVAKCLASESRADWGLLIMILALGSGLALIFPGAFALIPTALTLGLIAMIAATKRAGIRHYRALQRIIQVTVTAGKTGRA